MTAKEFVKKKMPTAKAERHVQGRIRGAQEPYWLIREGNQYMYFAHGKTESNAWVNAKKRLIELEATKKEQENK